MVPKSANGATSDWVVRVWNAGDGLPNNAVSCVTQAPDGYLWIGTASGLARFDGYRFETVPAQTLALDHTKPVVAILPSRFGGQWLVFDGGPLVRVNAGKITTFNLEVPPGDASNSIGEDAEGTVWHVSRTGELRRLAAGQMEVVSDRRTWLGGVVDLVADDMGRVWCAADGRLGELTRSGFRVVAQLPAGRPRLAPRHSGGLWICVADRVLEFDGGNAVVDSGPLGPAVNSAEGSAMLEDRAGGLWIGFTTEGLVRFKDGRAERIDLPHPSVRALAEDAEGDIWVATLGGGLARIQRRTTFLDDKDSALPFQPLQSLAADAAGNLWAVTYSGQVRRRVEGQWQILGLEANALGAGATSIACGPADTVWIGTRDRGLLRWREGKLEHIDAFPNSGVHSMLVAHDGSLWVTSPNPPEVVRLRPDGTKPFFWPRRIRSPRALVEDAAGSIWIGTTDGGLMRFSGDRQSDETGSYSLGAEPLSIRCLGATPDGSVWIGFVNAGLSRWKNGRYARIVDGLYDQTISQIVPDGRGYVWFGSDKGIFKVRQTELDAAADGRAGRVHSIVCAVGQNLPVLQPNAGRSPMIVRTDDRIWMPTQAGLVAINPSPASHPIRVAPRITRVKYDGVIARAYEGILLPSIDRAKRAASGAVLIPPRHRRISFEFAAPNFAAPELVVFRYRIEGVDDDWSEANEEHVVSYPRLPAGVYRFAVQAINEQSPEPPATAFLPFAVEPFVWETWWFRTLSIAAGMVLAAAAARVVVLRRMRLQLAEVEQAAAVDRERARIARDLHDDLGTRLTHLALLSGMAERDLENRTKMRDALHEITATVRALTDTVDETVWAINPRGNTLSHLIDYISQFAVEFLDAAGLPCDVDLPPDPGRRELSGHIRHNVFLAVKETLHNIVRHARATRVSFRMTVNDDELAIVISDDGRGFTSIIENAGGNGLRNLRQRMAAIGGRVEIDSAPGKGTVTRFGLPLPARHTGR